MVFLRTAGRQVEDCSIAMETLIERKGGIFQLVVLVLS
jgi:hypothetical protein